MSTDDHVTGAVTQVFSLTARPPESHCNTSQWQDKVAELHVAVSDVFCSGYLQKRLLGSVGYDPIAG
jgi:hypothetical protein